MLIGDFNLMIDNKSLENFLSTFVAECLIKKPTCFQSSNPTCIDLILTNKKEFFKNTDVIEVGISDHHSLIVTALKSLLLKGNAKTKLYRDYNSFNIDHFNEDLDNNLKNNNITEYSHFQNIFLEILHKHAPIKKKILRFNDNPFMTKALRKAIMHRSKLKNIFHKTRAKEDWNNYKKQRNFCVNLLRNTKKDYFQKLNIKDLTDNKKFWKTIKPFFSNKGLNSNKLMLREKDVVVADEKALATLMNNYFVNITADLDLKRDSENFYDTPASVYNIKKKFQDHQSVLKIKKAFNVTDLFSFHEITEDEIRKEISKLDGSKATPVGDIPAEMLKSTTDVHVSLLTKIINSSIRNGCFPDELKAAEVTPIFKKNDDLDKENYRPVSVLPHVSKIIERVMYIQIENFMEGKLSKLLTCFRKSHSTQHCLVNMLEKWKKHS